MAQEKPKELNAILSEWLTETAAYPVAKDLA